MEFPSSVRKKGLHALETSLRMTLITNTCKRCQKGQDVGKDKNLYLVLPGSCLVVSCPISLSESHMSGD